MREKKSERLTLSLKLIFIYKLHSYSMTIYLETLMEWGVYATMSYDVEVSSK